MGLNIILTLGTISNFYKVMNQKEKQETSKIFKIQDNDCLLYTSDAADEEDSVDLGGSRIIKKKKQNIAGRREKQDKKKEKNKKLRRTKR